MILILGLVDEEEVLLGVVVWFSADVCCSNGPLADWMRVGRAIGLGAAALTLADVLARVLVLSSSLPHASPDCTREVIFIYTQQNAERRLGEATGVLTVDAGRDVLAQSHTVKLGAFCSHPTHTAFCAESATTVISP
jgi:hypothetical protein